MTELCGWFGPVGESYTSQRLITSMTGTFKRDGREQFASHTTARSGLAVSAGNDTDLYTGDGHMAAVAGHPRWSHAAYNEIAKSHGHAKAFATAYLDLGRAALEHLLGDFSVVFINEEKREVMLATDRMGIQPMAYAPVEKGVVFGSSANAVRTHPSVRSRLSRQSIFEYLYFDMIPSPGTIYTELKKLEPAQCLTWTDGRLSADYYWQPMFEDISDTGPAKDYSIFFQLLQSAVKRNAPEADTGAFLSGGLDSSTVAGLLAGQSSAPVRSYSIGFEAQGYDEMHYARLAAGHFGLDAREYYVTPQDVVDAIPIIARAHDEPFGNSSSLAVYYCARLAKNDGIKTLLAGDGGDELFAGNERYAKQKLFNLYRRIPPTVRKAVIEPAIGHIPFGDKIGLVRKTSSYIQQANIPLPERLQTYNWLHREHLAQIFSDEFLESVDTDHPLMHLNEHYARANSDSALNSMLFLDWKITLADNDLRKVNTMCKEHGVDVRYPMLDDEVVEYSTKIAPSTKLRRLRLRHYYKEALKHYLPREIIDKQKHGFGLPFGVWLKTSLPLQELVYDTLSAFKKRKVVREDYIDELIRRHRTDHAAFYGSTIWVLTILELWLQSHIQS